ncbi:hypothetical protein GUJ93_ZPchr0004g38546 [Zizania palustris]|uniref:Uncharacterized protein n=1 Tax=Zizania palustris TaxID=103762 RepID=A0A8J5S1B3_ZIZPA|nr:hypothetical protein GUJ93_ZPchr0004g38546 [Zizania palustris]
MEEEKVSMEQEEDEKKETAVSDVSLKELSKKLDDFAKERDWEKYHAPRNLLLAMDVDEEAPSMSLSGWPIRYGLVSATTNLGTDTPTPTSWVNERRS